MLTVEISLLCILKCNFCLGLMDTIGFFLSRTERDHSRNRGTVEVFSLKKNTLISVFYWLCNCYNLSTGTAGHTSFSTFLDMYSLKLSKMYSLGCSSVSGSQTVQLSWHETSILFDFIQEDSANWTVIRNQHDNYLKVAVDSWYLLWMKKIEVIVDELQYARQHWDLSFVCSVHINAKKVLHHCQYNFPPEFPMGS